ncbi:hypothetical protein [Arthrobacter sp. H16F315]|uniref:hypothetical protein n=1 Tax=Arthrobacter sp. H16F315 TaxID=2955314 RepID=UPI00315808F8
MLAAAVSYHRRERKAFWWAHFDRCENGPDSHHQQDRNVFLVEDAEVLTEWRKDGAKLPERRVKLIGTLSPGSDLRAGSTWFRMYDPPLPAGLEGTGINGSGRNGWFGTEVLELGHEDGRDTVIIRDKLRRGIEPYGQVPVALTEDQPIQTNSLEEALATLSGDVAAGLTAAAPGFPRHPALDLVRRVPPRLVSGRRCLRRVRGRTDLLTPSPRLLGPWTIPMSRSRDRQGRARPTWGPMSSPDW